MESMYDDSAREKSYEENFEKMRQVKKRFLIYRCFNVFANIPVWLITMVGTYYWLIGAGSSAKSDSMSDFWSWAVGKETHIVSVSDILFPGCAVTAFITPLIIITSLISETFRIRKMGMAAYFFYAVIALFAFTNLIFGYEPMYLTDLVLLVIYGAAGCVSQHINQKNFAIFEELSHMEGFPEFRYLIDERNHSKYVQDREAWLEKSKKQDYFTQNEKPFAEFTVNEAEKDDQMDGISLEKAGVEGWFDGKTVGNTDTADTLDDLEADSSLLNEEDYIIEDIRRKPL